MAHKLSNPIIPGFYPDPSICRVGDDYYLACSSFELCPAIPIFHSRDLAHWEQISYALTPENGLHVEKNTGNGGVMAPTIRYHDGLFYLINMNYSDRGNYIVTAKDPAGPWSEPHWLTDVPGIDASIFFDGDGQCCIMGTGPVWPDEAGGMRQGIWVAKYDIGNFKMAGEPVAIFGGAFSGAASPEAPHIYHIGDYYYLLIAEGGTEHYHSATVARAKDVFGPYENNPANPVITHRHMGFRCPIGNVGHADLVELPDGSWYAVMLASRVIDGAYKNLGRETYICPVVWERDWPLFSPETGRLEWEYDAPACLPWTEYSPEMTREDFDGDRLDLCWSFWGVPYEKFYEIEDSRLKLRCIPQALGDDLHPMGPSPELNKDRYVSFLARRQRQPDTAVTCQMTFTPAGSESAGMAVVQAMNHQLHLERAVQDGKQVVRLVRLTSDFDLQPYMPGFASVTHRDVLACAPWDRADIVLRFELKGEDFTAYYGDSEDGLTVLGRADGADINPEKVGCMVGTMLGMFATGNGVNSDNQAEFDWCEMR